MTSNLSWIRRVSLLPTNFEDHAHLYQALLDRDRSAFSGEEGLKASWIETPIGDLLAIGTANHLHFLEFFDRTEIPDEIRRMMIATKLSVGLGASKPANQIAEELSNYFAGKSAVFKAPLNPNGTEFSKQVWSALGCTCAGQTYTYTQIAQKIGKPRAVRAMGRANGANQIAIAIPCHRITGANGALTGYGGGLWRKRWLLDHEAKFFAGH